MCPVCTPQTPPRGAAPWNPAKGGAPAFLRSPALRASSWALDPAAPGRYGPRMAETIETDVAIIGAGPVGLFAVFELGMLKLSSVLIDALGEVGGQCAALYPEKPIYDIPAHPAIEASELIAQLERQIAPFHAPRLLGRLVTGLAGTAGAFVLSTDAGDTVRAKAVVVAAGVGAFGPEPPAVGRAGRLRGQRRGAILRPPARGAARQARGDRRRRRFGGGLGAGAERHRPGRGGAPAGQVPRRAGKCGAARRRRGARRDRDGHPVPIALPARRGGPAARGRGRRPCKARRAACRPTCCWRSSAWRWTWGRSPPGAWRWSATT